MKPKAKLIKRPARRDLPAGDVPVPPDGSAWSGDINDYAPLIARADKGEIEAAMTLLREFASRYEDADLLVSYIATGFVRWHAKQFAATAAREAFNIDHPEAHRPRGERPDPLRVEALAYYCGRAAQRYRHKRLLIDTAVLIDIAQGCNKGVSWAQKLIENPTPEEELAARLILRLKEADAAVRLQRLRKEL